MIERLEKISAELFKNALKTYTAKDVLTHKRAHALNVPEMLSLYPNHGVGFIIRKKDWVKGIHYEVRRAVYKVLASLIQSHRSATFYGIKSSIDYSRTSKVRQAYPHRIQGLSKRGIWTYELGSFESFKNDNGVVYTRADYEAFLKLRGVGIRQEAPPKK